MAGTFIVLEGPDGGGKTSQIARLAGRIEATGRQVVCTREPGGTAIGEKIREILLRHKGGEMTAQAELLLFLAARAQVTGEVIRPALDGGAVVLSDRYMLSSVVYQGIAGGLGAENVERAGTLATGGVHPDLTLLLDLSPEEGLARSGSARGHDRMERKGLEYHQRVREGFMEYAREHPAEVKVIDAAQPIDAVANAIWEHVSRVLG